MTVHKVQFESTSMERPRGKYLSTAGATTACGRESSRQDCLKSMMLKRDLVVSGFQLN